MEEAVYYTPKGLWILCAFVGMSILINLLIWLARMAFVSMRHETLKFAILKGAGRATAGMALLSLLWMLARGMALAQPLILLPEISVLLMYFGCYLIWTRPNGASVNIGLEVFKIFCLMTLCAAGWGASFGAVTLIFMLGEIVPVPVWGPVFVTGSLWISTVIWLYSQVSRPQRTPKLQSAVLSVVILAILIVLIPGMMERWGNSEKIRKFLDPSPPIIRI